MLEDRGKRSRWLSVGGLLALTIMLAACGGAPEVSLLPTSTSDQRPTSTAPATPEPPKPTSLIICLAEEPESLYLYGDVGRSTDLVLEAIYDGPLDLLGFEYRPVILEKVPAIDDGDARMTQVAIASGDVYLNPETLRPETLQPGKPYLPPGCRSMECAGEYEDGEVEVERMEAEFTLLPDLTWSDGEPLTASDSVFSFELQGHSDTPASKYLYARTFSYEALDAMTVRWVGIPGFVDPEFAGNFWSPLPEHRLAEYAPGELPLQPAAAEEPLGWGPYEFEEWEVGRRLLLSRSETYSLPAGPAPFEEVIYRFIPGGTQRALDMLRTAECDLLDERLLSLDQLEEARAGTEGDELSLIGSPSPVVDRIDFNLKPAADRERPTLTGDVRTRQALAHCTNREALAEGLFGDIGIVAASFLPPDHPDFDPRNEMTDYDPEAGQDLLEEVGWIREEGDEGVRVARSVADVPEGTTLSLTLLTVDSELAGQIGERVVADWGQCGVEAEISRLPSREIFAGWGDGPVFGRTFDAVLWGWPAFASPPCEMFAGWELPGEENPLGVNAAGLQDDDYDQACRRLLSSPMGSRAYATATQQVQSRFRQLMPALPLFVRPQFVAHASWLCGVEPNPSANTVLWNLESLQPCP